MSLTRFNENLNIISSLEDKPTQDSTELKQKFDEAGNKIKKYINGDGENQGLLDELDTLFTNINTTINNIGSAISTAQLNKIYPIGSIYMSVNETSPSSFIGGTWERIQGRFLVGYGNNGATGYEAMNITSETGGESSHLLTSAESALPFHIHGPGNLTAENSHDQITSSAGGHSHGVGVYNSGTKGSNQIRVSSFQEAQESRQTSWDGEHTHTIPGHTHSIEGCTSAASKDTAEQAHNNIPPYLAVYMWKRIS